MFNKVFWKKKEKRKLQNIGYTMSFILEVYFLKRFLMKNKNDVQLNIISFAIIIIINIYIKLKTKNV
jgi:hypothetical protein